MARILAVDFGRRRIGLAICDELQLTVRGLPTLVVSNFKDSVIAVARVAREEEVRLVVVGLPLNMDGTKGEMAQTAEDFASKLSDPCGVSIVTFDERLSSAGAKNEMQMMGIKTKKKKGVVDRLAAVLILETYLQQIGG